jgi:nucleotidyltransferase/DNA polymerase involved in DNA repair
LREGAAGQTPVLADSITKIGPEAAGRVVVSGSHGGIYPAWFAHKGGCRAVMLHDAGVGLDRAGTAGLRWAEPLGMAVAAIDHRTTPIGRADLAWAQGIVSDANGPARAAGVVPGMGCAEAAALLEAAPMPHGDAGAFDEAREVVSSDPSRRRLVLIDSASLVLPADAGQVVVTGSHGALFGTDPANALRVDAAFALFNDAGGQATSRLPLLDARGVAAATVAASTARIGEARSTWQDGVISARNTAAEQLGIATGMSARDAVERCLGLPAA